jgi:hypothetical protein
VSDGHFFLFNRFKMGMDTDNDFRDKGAVFDGVEHVIFGFNTITGAVGSGVDFADVPELDVFFNNIENNGGPGIEVGNWDSATWALYFNTLSGNTPFQVEFNRGPDLPDEGLFYGASIPEGWIGNYYGRSGFLPGITSNGTDLCPLEHPLPNNVPAEVFNSLRCEECSSEEFFSALQARSLDDPSGDVSQKIESHLEPCPE